MSVYGLFQPSVLGMESQTHALNAIAQNISNVNTGGFKRTDVHFATVLSRTVSSAPGASPANPPSGSIQSDLGGVRPYDAARISLPGQILPTDRNLDIALTGNGFFAFNQRPDGSGEAFFGRDGRLVTQLGTGGGGGGGGSSEAYLVDKNGYYVMGWEAAADGRFPSTSTAPAGMRVDPDYFGLQGEPTTAATLQANLPATDPVGSRRRYVFDIYDSAAQRRDIDFTFTKTAPLAWDVAITGGAGDVLSIQPGPTPEPLRFAADGGLVSPGAYALDIAHTDGNTSSFTVDTSLMTQFGDSFGITAASRDGFPAGRLSSVRIDPDGVVTGLFDNGNNKPLYRLAIADFNNPDGLAERNGNVYVESGLSGPALIGAAGENDLGSILAFAQEISNVDIAEEFTKMIRTQHAYNASALSFRTTDEMTEVARDLKR